MKFGKSFQNLKLSPQSLTTLPGELTIPQTMINNTVNGTPSRRACNITCLEVLTPECQLLLRSCQVSNQLLRKSRNVSVLNQINNLLIKLLLLRSQSLLRVITLMNLILMNLMLSLMTALTLLSQLHKMIKPQKPNQLRNLHLKVPLKRPLMLPLMEDVDLASVSNVVFKTTVTQPLISIALKLKRSKLWKLPKSQQLKRSKLKKFAKSQQLKSKHLKMFLMILKLMLF